MADRSDLDAEINALKGEIKRSQPAPVASNPADAAPAAVSVPGLAWSKDDVERALKDLQTTFADVAAEAEDAIATNPMLSVGAAFLLGLVIGRLSKRI